MKVLHICADEAKASGVHTFCVELDAALRKLGVDSRIVTQITTERDSEEVLAWDLDVVHIHGLWLKPLHQAAIWARKNGFPIVWSTHGMTAPWSMKHKWWKKIIAWWLYQKWDLKRAAVIHSTTELERGWNKALGFKQQIVVPLGTHLTEGNELEKVVGVGGGGLVEGEVAIERSEIAEGLREQRRMILFVGRVYPVKALDNLIAAFQAVDHEDWKLRIVGPDQAGYMAELKKIAGKDVEFVGPKFGEELSKEYENCDCLALVSHTENFGATVVDAMAHGKPVITGTKTPWKVVADRGCGWWVDNDVGTLSKAIGEMMRLSDAERAEMGKRGRRLVEEKYTWGAVAKAMKEAYEKIG